MANYGDVALLAIEKEFGNNNDPRTRWNLAAEQTFPGKLPAQKKGCPRGAFLGLCEEGIVDGFEAGLYTSSKSNKAYALRAVALLIDGQGSDDPRVLWQQVINGATKAHNGQMDVVLALWRVGRLRTSS